jgi:hypothetical protein
MKSGSIFLHVPSKEHYDDRKNQQGMAAGLHSAAEEDSDDEHRK